MVEVLRKNCRFYRKLTVQYGRSYEHKPGIRRRTGFNPEVSHDPVRLYTARILLAMRALKRPHGQ